MNREPGLDPHNAGSTEPGSSADGTAEPTEHQATAKPSSIEGFSREEELLRECVGATSSLDARVLQLSELFQSRLAYDKAKEEAFDKLYAELDALKKNAALDYIKPLLLDLILLYDRMEHARRLAADAQGIVSTEVLQSFIHELLEVLYRREVSLIEAGPSSFDYNHQKAIGVVDVTDPAEHQRIHKVVRRGFRLGERTLRPEEVIVCRVPAPQLSGKPEKSEGHKS